jgi:DNA topoisomerase VI subunit B
MKKLEGPVRIILRSCLTGKAVWVYVGPSKEAARRAYYKVCKEELERVRNWPNYIKQRSERIGRKINEMIANLPINVPLTPKQKEAIKQLRAIQNEVEPCDMEFYNHIMEEARRRNAASKRWAEQRRKNFGIE